MDEGEREKKESINLSPSINLKINKTKSGKITKYANCNHMIKEQEKKSFVQ